MYLFIGPTLYCWEQSKLCSNVIEQIKRHETNMNYHYFYVIINFSPVYNSCVSGTLCLEWSDDVPNLEIRRQIWSKSKPFYTKHTAWKSWNYAPRNLRRRTDGETQKLFRNSHVPELHIFVYSSYKLIQRSNVIVNYTSNE